MDELQTLLLELGDPLETLLLELGDRVVEGLDVRADNSGKEYVLP